MTATGRGVMRCLAAAVLFGASAPAASRLVGHVPVLALAGLLYLGAAVAVAPIVVRDRPAAGEVRASARRLAVAVVFGGAVGPGLLVAGLARVPAASASLLLNFELVATLAVAAIVFREHLGARLVLAAAVVSGAGVLLVWHPGASVQLGGLFVVGACVAWGVDNGVTARIDQLTPAHITFAKGAVAGTVNLLLGVLVSGGWSMTWRQTIAALAIGGVGYGASITLWVTGARDLGAARGQVIFAAAPFVGAVVAWTALGERVSSAQLIAAPLVLVGVGLSLRTAHEHAHAHPALEHEHEHSHDDGHHDGHHEGVDPGLRHAHRHAHDAVEHAHPHVPDLHHGHAH